MNISIKRLTEDIMLIHAGSIEPNIYLIDKKVLIDSGIGIHKEELIKSLESIGVKVNDIERIINTHCHYDHVFANKLFPKAKVCIHEIDAEALEKGDSRKTCAFIFGKNLDKQKVSVKLKDGDIIRIGKTKLRIIHTPGHTDGSICIYDESRSILFTGDTVFCGDYGRTDLVSGSEKEIMNSIRKIAQISIKTILPGHGTIIENNERQIKKSLQQILKN